MARSRRRLTAGELAWLSVAAGLLALTVVRTQPEAVSFQSFYNSGLALRLGHPIEQNPALLPNLNPPIFAWLMVPFTLLPVRPAFWMWTAGGALCTALAIVASWKNGRIPVERWPWMAGSIGATMPALVAWEDGQITWWLVYPMTRAWLAARESQTTAGLWLAIAVILKPQLILMALLLPIRIWITAAITGAIVCGVSIAVGGTAAWREWFQLASQVNWLEWPLSASFWSAAARLQSGEITGSSMRDLHVTWWIVIPALSAAIAPMAWRARSDARWVLAFLWATLLSPLGQIYYYPLVLAPLAASWPGLPLSRAVMVLMCLPMPLIARIAPHSYVNAAILGSLYTIAVVLAWVAWARSDSLRATDTARAESSYGAWCDPP